MKWLNMAYEPVTLVLEVDGKDVARFAIRNTKYDIERKTELWRKRYALHNKSDYCIYIQIPSAMKTIPRNTKKRYHYECI